MTAFLYRHPAGVIGDVTRRDDAIVEPIFLSPALTPTAYGTPIKIVSGKACHIEANDQAAVVAGVLVRTAPTQLTAISGVIGGAPSPDPAAVQGIVTRGYVAVACTIGTPSRGGKVYMRRIAATGKAVGDFEATPDVTVAGGTITGTGTGTIAATVTADAIPGTWVLTLQSTSGTSKVTVIDPLGVRHEDATVGTPYTSGGLTFTITAGGTMTAGDHFAPVVTQNNVALSGWTWGLDGKDANGSIAEIHIA